MSKPRFFTKFLSVSLILLCLSGITTAFAASQTQKLAAKAPDDCVAFISFNGLDNISEDFNKTSLGQFIKDQSVIAFAKQMTSNLPEGFTLGELPNEESDSGTIFRALATVTKTPLIIGAAHDNASQGPVPIYGFIMIDAAKNKQQIDKIASSLFTELLGIEQIQQKLINGYKLNYTFEDDLAAYWGWAGDYFVFTINDPQGIALKNIKNTSANASYLTGITPGNDAADIYVNIERIAKMVTDAAPPEELDVFAKIFKKLGLSTTKAFKARIGFQGKNIISESLLDIPQPRTGLFNYLRNADMSMFNAVDANALMASSFNIDFAGIYDLVMSTLKENLNQDEYSEITSGLTEIESQLGLNLRNDLFANVSTPIAYYSLAPDASSPVPVGGFSLIIKPKDTKTLDKTLQNICNAINKESEGMLAIKSQYTDDVNYNTVNASFLAMMMVNPTWAMDGDNFVIASDLDLCKKTIKQIKTGDQFPSLAKKPDFKAHVAKLPPNIAMFSYTNSSEYFKQMHTQLQQVWPMLTMGAASSGVQLPFTLPNPEEVISHMQPSYSYTWTDKHGLHSKIIGLNLNLETIAAASFGAGIIMPALAQTRELSQRIVSGSNLNSIGNALMIYADENNGNYPKKLEELIEYIGLPEEVFISKRAPQGFNEPHYLFVQGQGLGVASGNILAYENPKFGKGGINVLYNDGHVEFVADTEAFKKHLKGTYNNLGKDMPETVFPGD